jgi:hypothetical protein
VTVIPHVLITLPIEAPPEVRLVCQNSSEQDRLAFWMAANPELLDS